MKYRTLGRSGLKAGAVSGSGNGDDSLTGLRRDHEVGINHLDANAPASAPTLTADGVAFVEQTLQG